MILDHIGLSVSGNPIRWRITSMQTVQDLTMPNSVIDIETQALGLTPEQRAQLADKLLSSLSPDAAIEQAWSAVALRRLEEMDNGSVTGVPVEVAIAHARSAIR